MSPVSIREADRVKILTDNDTNMLMIPNTGVVRRSQIRPPGGPLRRTWSAEARPGYRPVIPA